MSEAPKPDLAAIEGRLNRATPGPWRWADWQTTFGTWEDPNNKSVLEKNPKYDYRNSLIIPEKDVECERIIDLGDIREVYNEADLELIERAPTDIAALLTEVRRLRESVALHEAAARASVTQAGEMLSELTRLREENAELRERPYLLPSEWPME